MSRKSTSTAPNFDSTTPPDLDCDGTCYITDDRLETWDDPTPRVSVFTRDELHKACVDAAKRHFSLMTRSLTQEERLKRRDEDDRNSLMIALQAYTKKNNMQSTDLEFVEVKQRNLIDEYGKGFLHFNFVVKDTDGKPTTFFAELHPDLKDENDVYLCMPLEEKDLHPSVFFLKLTVTGVKIGPKILYTPVVVAFWVATKTLDFLSWNSRATTRATMMMTEGFMEFICSY